MARPSVQINVEGLNRWVNGLDNIRIDERAERVWDQANDVFFARTQQYAHIVSGDMVDTGRTEIAIEGRTIVAKTIYGGIAPTSGRLVDYVIYEIARGGSHDFYSRALVSTERMFQGALRKAVENMVLAAMRG